jgi:hypothetical protein
MVSLNSANAHSVQLAAKHYGLDAKHQTAVEADHPTKNDLTTLRDILWRMGIYNIPNYPRRAKWYPTADYMPVPQPVTVNKTKAAHAKVKAPAATVSTRVDGDAVKTQTYGTKSNAKRGAMRKFGSLNGLQLMGTEGAWFYAKTGEGKALVDITTRVLADDEVSALKKALSKQSKPVEVLQVGDELVVSVQNIAGSMDEQTTALREALDQATATNASNAEAIKQVKARVKATTKAIKKAVKKAIKKVVKKTVVKKATAPLKTVKGKREKAKAAVTKARNPVGGYPMGVTPNANAAKVAARPRAKTKFTLVHDREEKHGQVWPCPGTTCDTLWRLYDTMAKAAGGPEKVSIGAARKAAAAKDFHPTTTTVQFYRWRRFRGVRGRGSKQKVD